MGLSPLNLAHQWGGGSPLVMQIDHSALTSLNDRLIKAPLHAAVNGERAQWRTDTAREQKQQKPLAS